ncbi:MAG: hypothetical protein HQL38_07595, partial [Alphaproteobacteria bacterium]|nr:hypothetical protein [Alphaproteobacteria bacterium]
MTRVATYASREMFVQQMLTQQRRIHDGQVQVNTEQRSQDYRGLNGDSSRLVGFELRYERLARYDANNQSAEIRLKTQEDVVSQVEDAMTKFRGELADFSLIDMANGLSPEEQDALDQVQDRAFNTMKSLEMLLNTQVDGQYLFSGGKIGTRPVNLANAAGVNFGSLAAFQTSYNGIGQPWPTNRTDNLDPSFAAYHTPYYGGDQLEVKHRVDEDRTVTLGINASDGAFEKAFRALGMIAQGDLANNPTRVTDAMALLSDSLNHDTDPNSSTYTESSSDLDDLVTRIGNNRVIINDTMERNKETLSYMAIKITEIEQIDKVDVVTRMNDDLQALQISFQTLGRIQSLSLA